MKADSRPQPRTAINTPARLALLALLAGLAPVTPARADEVPGEFVFSAFTGVALTANNDLQLREPGGTDITFHNVSYSGRDFHPPPYYGARLVYFLPDQSPWGFGAEFFHAKVYLNTSDTVHVTGTRAGAPVDDYEHVGNTIQQFVIHNGLNFVTADAFYRWFPGTRGENFLGRFQPYVGAGIGAVIPYVEAQLIGGSYSHGYQFHGPGVLAMAGLNFDLTKHFSLFAEYKFSFADLGNMSISGGSVSMNPQTHNIIGGISLHL